MDHLKLWANNLINSIEKEVENGVSEKIIENCGRICANECGAIREVENITQSSGDISNIDLIIKKMNEVGIGGGKIQREGNTIIAIYEQCYCPSRKHIESTIFCKCTQGWAKEVFEKVLGKNVEVVLEKAIGWGDEICRFTIKY